MFERASSSSGSGGKRRGPLAAILASLVAIAAKAQALLVLLFKAKFLLTFATMFISMVVYGLAFGWAFGVGFVLILFVHELGHFIAIRMRGLPAGAPVFIPFMGAIIGLRGRPVSAAEEAFIGGAGPLLGTIASAAVLLLPIGPVRLPLAYTGFFLQLFNLIPVSPLDGGRMVAAVDRRLWWFGLPLLLGVIILTGSWTLGILLAMLVLSQFFGRMRRPEPASYFAVPLRVRLLALAAWLGLAAASGLGMAISERLGHLQGIF